MEDSANSPQTRRQSSRIYLALLLAFIGLFFLVSAFGIERTGLANREDPGPRFFPILLSVFLLGCALVEVAAFFVSRPSPHIAVKPKAAVGEEESLQILPVVVVGGTILIYILVLPRLGFTVSSVLFASAVLIYYEMRWSLAPLLAAAFVLVVKLLFTGLFEIRLPEGFLQGWLRF